MCGLTFMIALKDGGPAAEGSAAGAAARLGSVWGGV
jgi:hypothetical protein